VLPTTADKRLPFWASSIFTPRNALVHLGMTYPPEHHSHGEAARAFFQALLHLHELADADRKHAHPNYALFDPFDQLARDTVTAAEDEHQLRVTRLLASAQARRDGFGPDQLDILSAAATVAEHDGRDEPDRVYLACPVCGAQAAAVGRLSDDGDAEVELADGDVLWSWVPEFNVWIETLDCPVCALHLDAADLAIAGLPAFAAHPADSDELNDDYYHPSNGD
jgi:hypothetical protein